MINVDNNISNISHDGNDGVVVVVMTKTTTTTTCSSIKLKVAAVYLATKTKNAFY